MRSSAFLSSISTSLFALLLVIGCAGGGSPALPSTDGSSNLALDSQHREGKIIATDGPRSLWGLYTITITPDYEIYAEPMREALSHFNLTSFLSPPKCKYCLKLKKTGLDVSAAWISFNVSLANPTKLIGYDVRGIILEDEDFYLMNPDALTPYAGPVVYDTPNGFIAYATDKPNNAVPGDGNASNPTYYTREFKIHLPPPFSQGKLLQIKYAVDVSYPVNCLDPWSIGDFTLPAPVYESTPPMNYTIDIKDHQNNINSATLEPPVGWLGPVPTFAKIDNDTWGGVIDNCANNPAGRYQFYVTATSLDNSTPQKTLYLYRNVVLQISNFDCQTDPKNQPNGATKLPLSGVTWDTVCELNPRDFYLIDFADASMQVPGVLSGNITLNTCFPDTKIDLVYVEQSSMISYDSNYVVADASGHAVLPVHIPNSVTTGNEVEKCYVRVRIPGTAVVNAPYSLTTDLTYETTSCGDPLSISTVGAPDIPLTFGMVQGVLCETTQMDWYRLDTAGPDATAGHLTGQIQVDIESPKPLPGAAKTSISLHDEDGTMLANFYVETPPTPAIINLGDLDLPSKYVYYMCITSPTQSTTDRSYRMIWNAQIDPACGPDLINLTNPAAPKISPAKTNWNTFSSPGSSARMWLCNPDDMLDAYPFDIPSAWPGSGQTLGGTIRIQSDSTSFSDIKVSLGMQSTIGGAFSWYSPITLSATDTTFNVLDFWQAPLNISSYPLKYWLKVENTGDDWATAQLDLDMNAATGCTDEGDSQSDPSGSVVLGGTISSYVSPDTDLGDYWDLDWPGTGRLKGDVGAVAAQNIRLSIVDGTSVLASSEGQTPSINVNQFDFGAGCNGPILRVEPVGGSSGECVQYFVSGAGLSESSTCENDPDGNDTLAEIASKPWLWLDPFSSLDSICGVVCRQGGIVDSDVLGIAGQPFATQGVIYGYITLASDSPDGHEIKLVSMDGAMELKSDNLTPPFYQASVDLAPYSLPAIPPKGWKYHVVISPDPTGADSLSPYVCFSELGINSGDIDDGHDLQSESWDIGLTLARLGILNGMGDTTQIDTGLPDLADWFKLNYAQAAGEFLSGTIKITCETKDLTVRLMPEGQLAGSGIALYQATISSGDSATITIPDDTLPSIPATGSSYYIVVHNNGDPGWAAYALEVNLVSE
jgi:hypothetical protein